MEAFARDLGEVCQALGGFRPREIDIGGGFAVPRPRTPAYPVITSAFQRAFLDIRHGADVGEALDKAVARIDQDIEDNRGYPFRR